MEEWVYWQMANLGPMAGQVNHFLRYAPERIEYATNRYVNECRRLYGILEKRLASRKFICGEVSIADFASIGWARGIERQGQDPKEFPNVMRWIADMQARPATARALAIKIEDTGRSISRPTRKRGNFCSRKVRAADATQAVHSKIGTLDFRQFVCALAARCAMHQPHGCIAKIVEIRGRSMRQREKASARRRRGLP